MKKFRRIFTLAMALSMVLTLASCGNKDNPGDTSSETENVEGIELQEQGKINLVNKPELGITMELSGDYFDCQVVDLSQDEVDLYVKGGFKGFKLVKEIGGVKHTLSNIIVVESELASDPQVRGQFPYIYSGDKYTVLVNMQAINDPSVDSDTASRLNSGLMGQLTTMFFDESMMVATMSSNDTNKTDVPVEGDNTAG